MAISIDQARAAKADVLREFEKIAEVVGVGITRAGSDYAVKVNLRAEPRSKVPLPSALNGVPIRIEITGNITARDSQSKRAE